MINKFYDPQVAEPVANDTVQSEPVNIAQLMAKHGVVNSNETPVATPISINKEKAQDAEPAETATTTAESAEQSTTKETPKPTDEQNDSEPEIPKESDKVQSWQEVLKKQDPDTVLKALGFDEKVIGLAKELNGFEKADFFTNLVNHWKTKGDLTSYLKELTTDYAKMPAEEVMRHQLRREYPKASDKQLEVLFNTKIIQAYRLDSEDEDELENGRMLLEAEADKYRDTLIEEQKKYLFPNPPEKKQEADPSEEIAKREFEEYKNAILSNEFTKNILSTNKIVIGEGDDKFQYPVNANEITEVLFDPDKWQETQFDIVRNPDGSIKSFTPKVEHQLLTAAIAKYGKKFLNEYAKHYKALGGKAAIEPLENAKPPEGLIPASIDSAPKSPAEALAKFGRVNQGGY
jgi:hypothetical protein